MNSKHLAIGLIVLVASSPLVTPASADQDCRLDYSFVKDPDVSVDWLLACAQQRLDYPIALSASIDAPEYAYAGLPFSVVGEIRADVLGATIVEVLPILVAGPCTLVDFDLTGGVPLGKNLYLLTSDVNLEPVYDKDGDPVETFNTLDIHIKLDTAEDESGECVPGFKFIQLVNKLDGDPYNVLSKTVPIIELPATPIAMGTITTSGGNDVPDQALVTIPAVPTVTIVVLTSNPKVALRGNAVHKEVGATVDDEGYFALSENGVTVKHATLTKKSDSTFVDAERTLAHEKGKTIITTFCFFGVYVDDGVYETYEGPDQTCTKVHAWEPDDPEVGALMVRACSLYAAATLSVGGSTDQFLVPDSEPMAVQSPSETDLRHFLFDNTFGTQC